MLAVWLVVFSFRQIGHLVGILLGFLIAVAGGWWLITERPPRRWIGLAGAVVGMVIVVVVDAAADTEYPLIRVGIALVLFAVMSGSARLAVVEDLHDLDELGRRRSPARATRC